MSLSASPRVVFPLMVRYPPTLRFSPIPTPPATVKAPEVVDVEVVFFPIASVLPLKVRFASSSRVLPAPTITTRLSVRLVTDAVPVIVTPVLVVDNLSSLLLLL